LPRGGRGAAERDRAEHAHHHARGEAEPGGADGPEFDPLGRHGVSHRVTPYSTLSAVSSWNACSREGSRGLSPCSRTPASWARSPTRSTAAPVTSSSFSPRLTVFSPSAVRRAARSPADRKSVV